jgi:hypothetical protein
LPNNATSVKVQLEDLWAFRQMIIPMVEVGLRIPARRVLTKQVGGQNVRYAEIRGAKGEDVLTLHVAVITPKGKPSVPLQNVSFNTVNGDQPQIVVSIQTNDGSPIGDGYLCHFSFQSSKRSSGK